jgi:hypothetical protein
MDPASGDSPVSKSPILGSTLLSNASQLEDPPRPPQRNRANSYWRVFRPLSTEIGALFRFHPIEESHPSISTSSPSPPLPQEHPSTVTERNVVRVVPMDSGAPLESVIVESCNEPSSLPTRRCSPFRFLCRSGLRHENFRTFLAALAALAAIYCMALIQVDTDQRYLANVNTFNTTTTPITPTEGSSNRFWMRWFKRNQTQTVLEYEYAVQPLDDILFRSLPDRSNDVLIADSIVFLLLLLTILRIFFVLQAPQLNYAPSIASRLSHPRWILFRRFFWCTAILYVLRIITVSTTIIPNPRPHCPALKASNAADYALIAAKMASVSVKACTDNIFSGHALILMSIVMMWQIYFTGRFECVVVRENNGLPTDVDSNRVPALPNHGHSSNNATPSHPHPHPNMPNQGHSSNNATPSHPHPKVKTIEYKSIWYFTFWSRFLIYILALVGMLFLIMTRMHYTVDVILACIIVYAVYITYHLLLERITNNALRQDDSMDDVVVGVMRVPSVWPMRWCSVVLAWIDGLDIRLQAKMHR